MAATVQSDPVPSALTPIASVNDASVVSLTNSSMVNASEVTTKENQDLHLADTQLSMSDSTHASLPEVTKLSKEHFVDTVSSVVSDTKNLGDTPEPAIVLAVRDASKHEIEEVITMHSKDATVVSNVSDAATLVAVNEAHDTPKEAARSDTKPGADHTNAPEAVPDSSLSAAAEQSLVGAQQEFTPIAESSASDAIVGEPMVGSVAEIDPVVSTRVAIEAPVAEQLNEAVQPKEEEIMEQLYRKLAEQSTLIVDASVIPRAEEVASAGNEDAKKEAEEVKSAEVEATPKAQDKAAESEAKEAVADIKVEANEKQNDEAHLDDVSIQIDEAEVIPALGGAVEVPNASPLNIEEIAVEVVAPTPALVDKRQLIDSDAEDTPETAEPRDEAVSALVVTTEEVVAEGSETPRAEHAANTLLNANEETPVTDQGEQVEKSITEALEAESVAPPVVETLAIVTKDPHAIKGPVSEFTTETVGKEQEHAMETQAEDKVTKTEASITAIEGQSTPPHVDSVSALPEVEVSPVAEEVPVIEKSAIDGAPATTDSETAVNSTPAATSDEPPAQESIPAAPPLTTEVSTETGTLKTEVVPPEIFVAEETPVVDQTAAILEPAISTHEPIIPPESSSEPVAEVRLVDMGHIEVAEVHISIKEEDQAVAEITPASEETTVEESQTQELPLHRESPTPRDAHAEEPAAVEPVVRETASTDDVPVGEDMARTATVEVPTVKDLTTAEDVAEEPMVKYKSVEEEVIFEKVIAKELAPEPAVPVKPMEVEDAPGATSHVSIPHEEKYSEEPAIGEHAPVETFVAKEEESVEETHVAVPESAIMFGESKAEQHIDVFVLAEDAITVEDAVVEEAVKKAAIQSVEQPTVETAKELISEVAEEPVAEVAQKANEIIVAVAAEEPLDDTTHAKCATQRLGGLVVDVAVEQATLVAGAAETASDKLPASVAVPEFQEPTVQNPHLVKALVVEPSTPIIPSAEAVESVAAKEFLPQGVETITAASVVVVPVTVIGTSAEIHTEPTVEDQGKAHVAEADAQTKALTHTLTETAEPIAEHSLDESVTASETEEGDTTTETIMVPESIIGKKEEPVSPVIEDMTIAHNTEVLVPVPEKLSLNIPEEPVQIERPKSPWTPSFQVTTIGHGVSLHEDIPTQDLDTTEVVKDAQPEIVVEDKEELQLTNEVAEPEPNSLSWTPSYSVHSQGSPSPTQASLELENLVHAEEAAETIPSMPKDILVTEKRNTSAMDKDPELSQTVTTVDSEVAPGEDHDLAPQEVEVQPFSTSEPPQEEKDFAPGDAVVEEVVAESQEQEQVQDIHVPADPEETQKSFILDPSVLTHPAEQEHTASPSSWVPSYSVSQQGSPLPPQASLPSVAMDSTERDLTDVPAITEQPEVVQAQGIPIDAGSALPTVVVNDSHAQEPQEEKDTMGRLKTPWTPSYSVTRQGADVIEETQIESLTLLGQTTDETVPEREPRRSLSEEIEASGAFTPTSLIGAGVAGGAAALATSAVFRRSSESPIGTDRNDKQASPENGDSTPSELRKDKYFPTVEIPEDNSRFNTVSLPPLDENNALDVSSSLSPDASPISPRKRLESTTSSRLFPGGWFSNTSKIPDERTSLEVVQGVFSGSKPGTTAGETLVSPVMDPITPVREQSSSDKRRWCVIM